jgi:segregation and condensation protein B
MSKKSKKKNVKELTLDAVSALEGLLEKPLPEAVPAAEEVFSKTNSEPIIEIFESSLKEEVFVEEEVSPAETESLQASEVMQENESMEFAETELAAFETAEIEITEELNPIRIQSIIESALFASHRPVSIAFLKETFKGSQVSTDDLRAAIRVLKESYEDESSGILLEEVTGGYQIRTKSKNSPYLSKTLKVRPFKLSGPALEVLSIVAYKQPVVKAEIDQIRGVESGHLLRALMEKSIVGFVGKSELPGKPMLYGTTRKFLEIFNLRNLNELPSLSEIEELLPEGITEEDQLQKTKLADITEGLSQTVGVKYSENEEELTDITGELKDITTSFVVPKSQAEIEAEQEALKLAQELEAQAAAEITEPPPEAVS